MNENVAKKQMLRDARIILATIAVVSFIFRFWIVIIPAILGVFVTSIILFVIKIREINKKAVDINILGLPSPRTKDDVLNIKFSLIQQQISAMVSKEYPNAKWVWESPRAKKLIADGEPVYIRLNRAGGYRRAEVAYQDVTVTNIAFETPQDKNYKEMSDVEIPDSPKQENYGLIAFEWVEENVVALNNRINEAIGRYEIEVRLSADELPVRESWKEVCDELNKVGIENAESTEDGIVIKLLQKNAERE